MNWYKISQNNEQEDLYDKLTLSDQYLFRGTNNLNEIESIINKGKFLPSTDTIAGDPVLQDEYEYEEDYDELPEWVSTQGVNFTNDFFNAEGYGIFIIVAKPKDNARYYSPTDLHTELHKNDIIPVAILHARDYQINENLPAIKWINKNAIT